MNIIIEIQRTRKEKTLPFFYRVCGSTQFFISLFCVGIHTNTAFLTILSFVFFFVCWVCLLFSFPLDPLLGVFEKEEREKKEEKGEFT